MILIASIAFYLNGTMELLTKVFCDADHYTYDDLPGFAFSRSQTLGYGGEKTDFKYWLK